MRGHQRRRSRHGDLHMINMAVVPERFENHIGETKRHQILNGFLAEIMVNPVDLMFGKDRCQFIIDFL